jgi:hypothetical protein
MPMSSRRSLGADDLLAEREQRQRHELERLDAERDPDDREAQRHPGDGVAERQEQPGDEPQDVADDASGDGVR